MLAYRHAFHAGNHGDVLKHVVLVALLRHFNLKDKGWRYVDTHAGAGGYSLDSSYARKKGEFEAGIGRLWPLAGSADVPPAVADYLQRVKAFNGGAAALEQYPGSPALALALARPRRPGVAGSSSPRRPAPPRRRDGSRPRPAAAPEMEPTMARTPRAVRAAGASGREPARYSRSISVIIGSPPLRASAR